MAPTRPWATGIRPTGATAISRPQRRLTCTVLRIVRALIATDPAPDSASAFPMPHFQTCHHNCLQIGSGWRIPIAAQPVLWQVPQARSSLLSSRSMTLTREVAHGCRMLLVLRQLAIGKWILAAADQRLHVLPQTATSRLGLGRAAVATAKIATCLTIESSVTTELPPGATK